MEKETKQTSSLDHNVDNRPAWLQKRDDPSKKGRLFIHSASFLQSSTTIVPRRIPLSVENDLPAVNIRFGSTDGNDIVFACHLDSYTAMNTANSLLYMWIMTTYPDIVISYEQFNDNEGFQPITLDCAIPSSEQEKDDSKLSAAVTYKMRCVDATGKMIALSFGLGDAISVNAIIGLPTFKEWKLVLDVAEKRANSTVLGCYFDLTFNHAANGLPTGVTFTKDDFFLPPRHTAVGSQLVALLEGTKPAPILVKK